MCSNDSEGKTENNETTIVLDKVSSESNDSAGVVENNKQDIIILKVEETVDYTQEKEINLGRLKRTLSEKCPCCGKALQLRVRQTDNLLRGETIIEEEEYKQCSVCDYEEEIKNPKKRKMVFDKTRLKKEDLIVEDGRRSRRGNNNGYPQRTRTDSNHGTKSEGGVRRNQQRNPRNFSK
jgi:hypothetical protein